MTAKRPTGLDYIKKTFSGLYRVSTVIAVSRMIPLCVGGIAKLDSIAIEKGHAQACHRNFGMPQPEGYRKALRLMKQAEKFGEPIVCFVDTSVRTVESSAEERGQGQAIARKPAGNVYALCRLSLF